MIRGLLQDAATFRLVVFVVASGLIGMALAALYTARTPLVYEASATVLVSSVTKAGDNNPLTETNDAQQKVLTLAQLATSNVVVERVIASMDLDRTPESLRDSLEAEAVPQTVLVEITAQDQDPAQARQIANFVALELDGYVQELNDQSPGAAAETSAQLVDPALTPAGPESPQPSIMLALGLLGGLSAGTVLAVVMTRRDDHVRTEPAVEALTGLPSLGAVPLVAGRRLAPADVATSGATAEGFSRIRNNLLGHLPTDRPVLAVVGLEAGEGKTSVSLGLARALAQHGLDVLLIDADPRDHRLTSGLGLDDRPGWLSQPDDALPVTDRVAKDVFDGLDVLPVGAHEQAGRSSDDHAPVPVTTLQPLMDKLSADYDVVVVDTPGLRSSADSALIARYSDGSVLVVPAGRRRQGELALSIDAVTKAGGSVLGTVLNFAPATLP